MEENRLEELNSQEAKQHIGGVVFVSIMMLIGIIGNLHVLFIYIFRMKPSNHRVFILFLASLDMITCVIGMPFSIVDLKNPLTFTMVSACKALRCFNYFTCSSSVMILTVISIERYRKICVPLGKQFSRRMAKNLCCVCLGISLVLSWPVPVLYGHSSVNTTNPNITGVRCNAEDKFKSTNYLAYFNAVLILVVFGVFGILVVLYSLIARAISKHIFQRPFHQPINSSDKFNVTDTTAEKSNEEQIPNDQNKAKNLQDGTERFGMETKTDSGESRIAADSPKKKRDHFARTKRTSFMFFLITAFFFLSYFPHLVLNILAFVQKEFVENLSFAGKVMYNTFLWCFFINNIVNAFIYGFCDRRFRKEMKKIYMNNVC